MLKLDTFYVVSRNFYFVITHLLVYFKKVNRLQYNNCNNIVDVEEKNISDIMRSWLNSTILYIQLFNLTEYEPRSILSSLMYSHFSVAKYGRGILLTITNLDSIQQIYSFFEGTPPLD